MQASELLASWPHSISNRLDRALCNLAKLSPVLGTEVAATHFDPPLLFGRTQGEAGYVLNTLLEENLIQGGAQGTVRLQPKGWMRVDEIERRRSSPEHPAFVAMWYGDAAMKPELDELNKQIESAVKKARYLVTRADLEEHSDYIMDRVLGCIRVAPFVVADFTGHRNGVYYEAAFARGLGIRVIQTCKKGELEKAHFDTKQLNHIVWDSPADIEEKLYNRIIAMLGEGPHNLKTD